MGEARLLLGDIRRLSLLPLRRTESSPNDVTRSLQDWRHYQVKFHHAAAIADFFVSVPGQVAIPNLFSSNVEHFLPKAAIRLQVAHELYHVFQDARERAEVSPDEPLARVVLATVQENKNRNLLQTLGDRAGLLRACDAIGRRGGEFGLAFNPPPEGGSHFLHFSTYSDRTLSARAFDRVWTSIAEALAEAGLDDYSAFVETFSQVLGEAVRRESESSDLASPVFEDVPSTCEWVHHFCVRTGQPPPWLSDAPAPLRGNERHDTGGLYGLVRGRKTERHIRDWPRPRRLVGGLRRHPARADNLDALAQSHVALGGRQAFFDAGRPLGRARHAALGNQLRVVRGHRTNDDAPRIHVRSG